VHHRDALGLDPGNTLPRKFLYWYRLIRTYARRPSRPAVRAKTALGIVSSNGALSRPVLGWTGRKISVLRFALGIGSCGFVALGYVVHRR
jgi:hypothetical protein